VLALTTVEDRLLKEGRLSQRKIARRLGVSRGTVSAIANGQRALFGRTHDDTDSAEHVSLQPAERCPKCGFFVHLPCLVCRAREYRHGRRVLAALEAERKSGPRRARRLAIRRRRRSCRSRVA
jgi:Helix-turn-helix